MVFRRSFGLALGALAGCHMSTGHAVVQYNNACAEGYVLREAFEGDHVCVTPETHDRAKSDNEHAAKLRAGKDSDQCVRGLVWRLANPDDHVCVPQLTREQTADDNRLASSRLAASSSPELSPSERLRAATPLPPAEEGCHILRDGKWAKTPCATPEEMRNLRRPVPFSIQDKPRWVFVGRGGIAFSAYTLPLDYSAIDIDVISDPTRGTVTDVLDPGSCTQVTKHQETKDSFSVQLNSNVFPTPYGSTGWVQFVEQRIPGQNDLLCVWKIDVGVANASGNNKGYEPVCVALPQAPGRAFLGATAVRDVPGHAHVEGFVQAGQDGKPRLTAWGGFSWDNPCCASITTPDTVAGATRGLANDTKNYNFGFGAGEWTQVTGDIYGTGCGSKAVFAGTKLSERVTASTCTTQPNCDPELTTEFSLSRFATPVDDPDVTGESNNLLRDEDFFNPNGRVSRTTYKCVSPATCKWWGNFHSPN
jgi:hypothetical protein